MFDPVDAPRGAPLVMAAALLAAPQLDTQGYVLLVMDDPFLRQTARAQAESLGLPVQEGLSVKRALARLSAQKPELVLLDLWIDRGEGLKFMEGLRRADPFGHVPVLLVGDDPRADVQVRALQLGAEGPIPLTEMAELSPWLDRVLGSSTT